MRIFHVESEFEVKNEEIRRPGAKIKEKRLKLNFFIRNLIFACVLLCFPIKPFKGIAMFCYVVLAAGGLPDRRV